jgi:hypothetical protein
MTPVAARFLVEQFLRGFTSLLLRIDLDLFDQVIVGEFKGFGSSRLGKEQAPSPPVVRGSYRSASCSHH